MSSCACGAAAPRRFGPNKDLCDTCRFWSYVDKSGDCWEWTGGRSGSGYGAFWIDRLVLAHRHSYFLATGESPGTLDHLCRNRGCVRPAHLEAVTQRVNTLRGVGPAARNATKTHCLAGHEFTPENTYMSRGRRHCRACNNRRQREYMQRKSHYSPSSFMIASK